MFVIPFDDFAGIPHALHGIERLAPDEERIELLHHPGEVDLGIHHDPVVLAVGPGDVAVEAHRAAESNQSHKRPRNETFTIPGTSNRPRSAT